MKSKEIGLPLHYTAHRITAVFDNYSTASNQKLSQLWTNELTK